MAHLIESVLTGLTLQKARDQLIEAHDFIASRCIASIQTIPTTVVSDWGICAKRVSIDLLPQSGAQRPHLIGKNNEKFSEAVNILATLERLIDALNCFIATPSLRTATVRACHPATSSVDSLGMLEHDLIIEVDDQVVAVCEVSDVIGSGGKKEGKDVESLKRARLLYPNARLFLCISSEFYDLIGRKKIYLGKLDCKNIQSVLLEIA